MSKRLIIRKGAGANYNYSQDHCYVKLASRETNGELCIVEDQLKPGFTLGRHIHKKMTEVFYVVEGEIDFIFDDEVLTLAAGDTLTIPPEVWHAAECRNGGRMLTVFKNGRFDEYLERLSSMSDDQFQNAELMKSLSEEFDIYDAPAS